MKKQLITVLLNALLSMLTPELLREFADMALDWVEDKVKDTANTLDDQIVLPVTETIRKAFNLPDDD